MAKQGKQNLGNHEEYYRPVSGKDEMNLAEFPIAALGDQVPDGIKTLEFTDVVRDRGRGNIPVTRKLMVTGSDKWGLPTAKDEEVILALIQLTAQQKFEHRKIHFTPYRLLKELGWEDTGRNYKRLHKALRLWVGVTLHYDRAWWAKKDQCWIQKSFHMLSDLQWVTRGSHSEEYLGSHDGYRSGLSYFSWDETIFKSFQDGNLMSLDMDVYRGFKTAIAKRMYRYLSKRFYQKSRLRYELKHFAYEKVGVSRKCHTGLIKRRLRPAIKELEDIGCILPMPDEERFVKDGRQWFVAFTRQSSKSQRVAVSENRCPALVKQLEERGITLKQASRLANDFDQNVIKDQLEYFDHLVSSNDFKVSRNPAGYLYKAITDGYEVPKTFESSTMKIEKRRRAKKDTIAAQKRDEEIERKRESQRRDQKSRIQNMWNSLDTKSRESIEEEIASKLKSLMGKDVTTGPIAEAVRESVIAKMLDDKSK